MVASDVRVSGCRAAAPGLRTSTAHFCIDGFSTGAERAEPRTKLPPKQRLNGYGNKVNGSK